MEKVYERLNVYLKGGQTVEINFNAEKPEKLNAQVDDFIKTLGDPAKKDGSYLFQGSRVVLIRLADVSAVDVVSLIAKEEAPAK